MNVEPEDLDLREVTPDGDSFTAELMVNHMAKGKTFIDIGARHGHYSLLIARRCPGCSVISFEPDPADGEILRKNLGRYGAHNVDVMEAGDSRLNDIKGNCVVRISLGEKTISALEDYNKILKKDNVELIVQCDRNAMAVSGFSPEKLWETVDALGYKGFIVDDKHRLTYGINDRVALKKFWEASEGRLNILCRKKESSLSVCFFSHSPYLSGAERGLLELVTELIKNHGVLCTVILPGDGPLRKMLESAGSSVLIVGYGWWCDFIERHDAEISRSYNNGMNALHGQIDRIAQIDPDIIVTNTLVIPWGTIAALALDKPHVWHVREFGQVDHGLHFHIPIGEVADVINTSNLVVTNSNAVKEALFKDAPEHVTTIYNYVNIPSGAQAHNGTNYYSRRNATKLIVSGSISESKGQMDALQAVNKLVAKGRDVELVMMGTQKPSYVNELKAFVDHNGLADHVKFFDFEANPYPAIDQADIMLVCSRSEAFGRVIVEAMLLKKPVIGTSSGGIPELIRDGINGLLYDPGDADLLADRIEYLMDHRDLAAALAEDGYRFATRSFTEEKYGGEFYKRLCGIKNEKNNASSPLTAYMIKQMMMASTLLKADEDEKLKEAALRQQKDSEINNLKEEIRSINQSVVWKSLMKYQALVDRLMPRPTRRRRAYDQGLTAIRKPFNKGGQ